MRIEVSDLDLTIKSKATDAAEISKTVDHVAVMPNLLKHQLNLQTKHNNLLKGKMKKIL